MFFFYTFSRQNVLYQLRKYSARSIHINLQWIFVRGWEMAYDWVEDTEPPETVQRVKIVKRTGPRQVKTNIPQFLASWKWRVVAFCAFQSIVWNFLCTQMLMQFRGMHVYLWCLFRVNTLRTGDASLRFYITTAQDGWRKSAFLTRACFPCTIHLTFRHRASSVEGRRLTTLQRTLFIYCI